MSELSTLLLHGNGLDASPATAGRSELLPDDWLEEGETKINEVVALLPLSDIDAAIVLTSASDRYLVNVMSMISHEQYYYQQL